MTKYKGYYIDHVVFNSKKDIDEFCKNELIKSIKKYTDMMFCDRYDASQKMVLAGWIADREHLLHDEYGMSYEEIEAIGC